MKTIRISRQGFPNQSMHGWIRYFIFVLSKKYNVIVDPINPDIVLVSNISFSTTDIDTFLGVNPTVYDINNKNRKFLFVSGELSDFNSVLTGGDNFWVMGYQNIAHPRYFRQPSYVIDSWVLFDESRIFDHPYDWLLKKRNFDKIKLNYRGFCSVTQSSDVAYRGKLFDALCRYKQVTSSGPWRQNIFGEDTLNKNQWLNHIYSGRMDGLTYREKIKFFSKYKFNIAVHFGNSDYLVQEKILHAYAANTIPLFYGNRLIEEEGFNQNTFINLHNYNNFEDVVELVKEIDNNEDLNRKYIEEPIFVDNKLPEYFDIDNILDFLTKVVES